MITAAPAVHSLELITQSTASFEEVLRDLILRGISEFFIHDSIILKCLIF
jgi:hypothetical protein